MAIPGDNLLLTSAIFNQDLPLPVRRVGFDEVAEVKVVWMEEGTQENLPEWMVTETALGDIRKHLEEIQAADPARRQTHPKRQQPRIPQEINEVIAIRRMAKRDAALQKIIYKPLTEGELKRINIPKMQLKRERLELKNEHIYRHKNLVFYEINKQYLEIYDTVIAEAAVMQGLD